MRKLKPKRLRIRRAPARLSSRSRPVRARRNVGSRLEKEPSEPPGILGRRLGAERADCYSGCFLVLSLSLRAWYQACPCLPSGLAKRRPRALRPYQRLSSARSRRSSLRPRPGRAAPEHHLGRDPQLRRHHGSRLCLPPARSDAGQGERDSCARDVGAPLRSHGVPPTGSPASAPRCWSVSC